jgi:hypothetical protein
VDLTVGAHGKSAWVNIPPFHAPAGRSSDRQKK